MKKIQIATASTRTGATSVISGAFTAGSFSAGALVFPLQP